MQRNDGTGAEKDGRGEREKEKDGQREGEEDRQGRRMNESAAARAGAREKEQPSHIARRGGRTATEREREREGERETR